MAVLSHHFNRSLHVYCLETCSSHWCNSNTILLFLFCFSLFVVLRLMLPVSLGCPFGFLWGLFIDDVNQSVYPFLNVKIVITSLWCLFKINTTVLLCWSIFIFICPRSTSCVQCFLCLLISSSIISTVYIQMTLIACSIRFKI
jgi:hypothetical protein